MDAKLDVSKDFPKNLAPHPPLGTMGRDLALTQPSVPPIPREPSSVPVMVDDQPAQPLCSKAFD